MVARQVSYLEYKDSGVSWLGVIPNHWMSSRIKYLCEIFGRIGFRGYTTQDIVDEGDGVIALSPSNIIDDSLSFDKKTYISWKKYHESPEIMVEENDILLVKTSTLGKVALIRQVDEPMTINPQMALLKRSKINQNFLTYVLQSDYIKSIIDVSNAGSTMPTMSQECINSFPVPIPCKDEIKNIADFLDHETAKIDTLIDKQQQLIRLLKEKRQAVISHAVTKGLNPAAPMKESGVEWLGEVPEHWVKIKVKRLFKFAKRQGYEDLTVLSVYRDHGVIVKSSRDDNFNKTPDNLSTYQLVNEGDLVINKMKAWQGSMGISDFEGITSPDYAVYSPLHRNEDSYLHFWFRAGHMPDVYRNISTGIRPSQWRLDLEEFEHLDVFMPSQEERATIVERIKEAEERYLKLIDLAETQISLLSERRTALISAAVTGKINVRNWQPAESKIPMEASA